MDKERFFSLCRGAGLAPADASYREKSEALFACCDGPDGARLAVSGPAARAFDGTDTGEIKLCPLSEENLAELGKIFPWVLPVSTAGHELTIGFGDRLGLVTEAHIASLAGTRIFPVLAQQSKRELGLTGRSFSGMLAEVGWQVFRCGYQGGYAADGDHLKTAEEIRQALDSGATMITLDCSEHLDDRVDRLGAAELRAFCTARFDAARRERWLRTYAGRSFSLGAVRLSFSEEELYGVVARYGKALDFMESICKDVIRTAAKPVIFEISIDETATATAPNAHFFVAAELCARGVSFDSMAPRFCGEFQKGIDYIGDLEQLNRDVEAHAAIAEHFGYRLSVHSGSDKFSAFPVIGKHCRGKLHLKTSGTSWVEALRVIAAADPALFRRLMHGAAAHFEEAKTYYHVSALPERVPPPESVEDARLPELLNEDDARQLMHITYGFLLQEKGPDGKYLFRDDIYACLSKNRAALRDVIVGHFLRHYRALGIERSGSHA